MKSFREKLAIQNGQGRYGIAGLDPNWKTLPIIGGQRMDVLDFLVAIIDSTWKEVAGFKLNLAAYERLGDRQTAVVESAISRIRLHDENKLVVLDGKRGDIGQTNEWYGDSLFDNTEWREAGSDPSSPLFQGYHADAVTWNNYLGEESMQKLLDLYPGKYYFVLCRTSNKGGGEFQDRLTTVSYLELARFFGEEASTNQMASLAMRDWHLTLPHYQYVALRVADWNRQGEQNCGLVTGATYPEELLKIRQLVGDNPVLLIPGIGKQGGDLGKAVQFGRNSKNTNFLINSSSGIIHASVGEDFAQRALEEAINLNAGIHTAIMEAAA